MSFDLLMHKLDQTVTGVLRQWDLLSTVIATVILATIVTRLLYHRDPDAHPFILARQSQASPIRNEGESTVLRSHSAPHGMELGTGLNVKDAGASRWGRGRDGDLRDVWKKAISGVVDKDDKPTGQTGKILTVLGVENIIDHDLGKLSQHIKIIGKHIQQRGGNRVAVYLPNSVELLLSVFACAFYDLTPILLPFDQSADELARLLTSCEADTLVADAGSCPFDTITKECSAIREVIWVVDEGNKHLDWTEIPAGTGGAVQVSTWQALVEDSAATTSGELPMGDPKIPPPPVLAYWPAKSSQHSGFTAYTQANLVSGISGQLFSLPSGQRFSPSDLFAPVESLSTLYVLLLTLTALYCNSSVALNSVAGSDVDLTVATKAIAPTVIVASASTMLKVYEAAQAKVSSPIHSMVHWLQTRTLTQGGVMPIASFWSALNDMARPVIGTTPGKLRLIYVPEQAHMETPALNSSILSDLRLFTGARIVYALTAAPIAGPVAQTNIYDYRVDNTAKGKCSHFGAPVTSVEIFLRDTADRKTTDERSVGEICVRGPAVVGGEAALGVVGSFKDDYTLAYN